MSGQVEQKKEVDLKFQKLQQFIDSSGLTIEEVAKWSAAAVAAKSNSASAELQEVRTQLMQGLNNSYSRRGSGAESSQAPVSVEQISEVGAGVSVADIMECIGDKKLELDKINLPAQEDRGQIMGKFIKKLKELCADFTETPKGDLSVFEMAVACYEKLFPHYEILQQAQDRKAIHDGRAESLQGGLDASALAAVRQEILVEDKIIQAQRSTIKTIKEDKTFVSVVSVKLFFEGEELPSLNEWVSFVRKSVMRAQQEKGWFAAKWVNYLAEQGLLWLSTAEGLLSEWENQMSREHKKTIQTMARQITMQSGKVYQQALTEASKAAVIAISRGPSRASSRMVSTAPSRSSYASNGVLTQGGKAKNAQETSQEIAALKECLPKFFSAQVLPVLNELAYVCGIPLEHLPFPRMAEATWSVSTPSKQGFFLPASPNSEYITDEKEQGLIKEAIMLLITEDGNGAEGLVQKAIVCLGDPKGKSEAFKNLHQRLSQFSLESTSAYPKLTPSAPGYLKVDEVKALKVSESKELAKLQAHYQKCSRLWNCMHPTSKVMRYLPIFEPNSKLMSFLTVQLQAFNAHTEFTQHRKGTKVRAASVS